MKPITQLANEYGVNRWQISQELKRVEERIVNGEYDNVDLDVSILECMLQKDYSKLAS